MADTPKQQSPAVYCLTRSSRCYNCDKQLAAGEIIQLVNGQDEREVRCRACAELADHVLVPKGDQKLTRQAKKLSKRHYVVLQWSALWKTYERVGILVEAQALEKAKSEP